MTERSYRHIIVGGGLAGASAAEGIRDIDRESSLLIIGKEPDLPYDRPPLTKKLWFGQKRIEDIFLHDMTYYAEKNITLLPGREVTGLDIKSRTIRDSQGDTHRYDNLLIATGGFPRKLAIPGGDLDDICYYRYLSDYRKIRAQAAPGVKALVMGGGFIGAEIAAALNKNGVQVTMLFPDEHLLSRIFPESLARSIESDYATRGVTILAKTLPVSIERQGEQLLTTTSSGQTIISSILIAGIGIQPSMELARIAGLEEENGIMVNEYLETSSPGIYAAGDNTFFPSMPAGTRIRVEHWDNAVTQGRHAGRNMAGTHEPYTHMPYFFSDLFDFGFEAVGTIDSRLEMVTDWQVANERGLVWYLNNGRPSGVMMYNIWDRVEAAREWISKGEKVSLEDVIGAAV